MKYLLIGGGPASISAASTLRRLDTSCEITILTKEPYKPYAKMALPYLIAEDAQEAQIYLPEPDGINILVNQEVVSIDPDKHQAETAHGQIFEYDRLLVATGGTPERLKVEGADLPFVFTIRDLDDVSGIKKQLNGRKGRAVIAGAGPVSMETGDALHKIGMDITFVISSNRVFSTLMDVQAASFVEKQLLGKGVEIRKGEDIVRIDHDGTVRFRSGDAITASLVIVGKGVKPSLSLLEGSGIAIRSGIVVDEHQRTNIDGIYAAGDICETYDIAHEDHRLNALWPEAYEQGKVAAFNMASIPVTYQGSLSRNILRAFGISVMSAGMARADGPDVRMDVGNDHFRKIVLDDGVLKGLIFVGDVRNEGLYMSLIKRRKHVLSTAGSILRGTYGYAQFMHRATTCRQT